MIEAPGLVTVFCPECNAPGRVPGDPCRGLFTCHACGTKFGVRRERRRRGEVTRMRTSSMETAAIGSSEPRSSRLLVAAIVCVLTLVLGIATLYAIRHQADARKAAEDTFRKLDQANPPSDQPVDPRGR